MALNLSILFFLILAAIWTVMTRSLLRSAMGLALVSVILTIVMFRLNSPLAAVFELSVCAGLIPVLFISAISLSERLTHRQKLDQMKKKLSRFWSLPIIVIILGIILSLWKPNFAFKLPSAETIKDVRYVLWGLRPIELLGQIMILLTGVFGVVILFKERQKK